MKGQFGSQCHFEQFIDSQVKVYKELLRQVYGLPDPEDFPRSYIEITRFKPLHNLVKLKDEDMPLDAVATRLFFQRQQYHFLGKTYDIWCLGP